MADAERCALLFGREWTCAGAPLDGVDVQARGPDGAELGEGQEGELWVRGVCRMLGYHGDPEATAEVCSGEWLYTGDLGFWVRQGGERYFFITGRKKELIVRAVDKY
jgi:long-subunit acyl-CoA synthetase (AMP-forming)